MRWALCGLMAAVVGAASALSALAAAPWTEGPGAKEDFFPIGVWLQDPSLAEKYKAAGINTYIGLWNGPTEEQLAKLKAAGMYVICHQNEVGLKHKDNPMILGWLLPDEPDNAQPNIDLQTKKQNGWGPCVPPAEVMKWYEQAKAADPSRPVLLNLGCGVAYDQWVGRGTGAKQSDYLDYVKACDVVSFDVYPVASLSKKFPEPPLWMVGEGVRRLRKWTDNKKPVWAVIETGPIDDPEHGPTPEQVKQEVRMALENGATGIVYFVHQFKPKMNVHRLLDDPEMLKAVTEINKEITENAATLNAARR